MGIDKVEKLARPLVGKVFTAASLHREVNRIMPDAWWGSAPTPRGMCIYAEKDGIEMAIQLDSTGAKNKFKVRKVDVGYDTW